MYIIYQHYGRGRCSGTNERLLKADVGVRSGWRGDYAGEAVRGDGAGIRVNRARERSHTEEERPARPARRSRSMAVPVPSPSTVRQRLNDPAGPPKPHFIGRMPWDQPPYLHENVDRIASLRDNSGRTTTGRAHPPGFSIFLIPLVPASYASSKSQNHPRRLEGTDLRPGLIGLPCDGRTRRRR